MKRALIFGASGQAGYYLQKLLIHKGYSVMGTYHNGPSRASWERRWLCDVRNPEEIRIAIRANDPDEVYNLAARMFAPASWLFPDEYMQVNAVAVATMLETLSVVRPQAKFFQAGSADVFDQVCPLNEDSPIRPRTPYGISKATAQELVRVYREQKGMFACTGILFNMESPRRPDTFFSVKVAKAVARMAAGLQARGSAT